jgi:hypothetical protein
VGETNGTTETAVGYPYLLDIINITFSLLLLILLLLLLISTFMHDIYNYIRETNHVPTVHNVAVLLYSQFALHVMLFRT